MFFWYIIFFKVKLNFLANTHFKSLECNLKPPSEGADKQDPHISGTKRGQKGHGVSTGTDK